MISPFRKIHSFATCRTDVLHAARVSPERAEFSCYVPLIGSTRMGYRVDSFQTFNVLILLRNSLLVWQVSWALPMGTCESCNGNWPFGLCVNGVGHMFSVCIHRVKYTYFGRYPKLLFWNSAVLLVWYYERLDCVLARFLTFSSFVQTEERDGAL